MKNYPDFIEQQMKSHPNDELTFSYKRSVLDAMENRSAILRKRGITDENVIIDLVCSENNNIEQGYFEFLKKEKDKKRIKKLPRNIVIYMVVLIAVFLCIGFTTSVWHPTWLLIEGGVSLMVVYLLVFLASHLTGTPLYPVARLCIAGSVMVLTQFIFLCIRIPFGVEDAYLLFLAAVGLMLFSDGLLASLTKQKFAFLSWLIYIPAITGLLYALLGITGFVAWNPGWWIMVAAVAADVILVVGTILYKGRFSIKQELENIWKEN